MSATATTEPARAGGPAPGAASIVMLLGVARVGLAGLFLYTGLAKAADPGLFAQDIANYRVVADGLLGPIALLLPALEIATGVGLLLRAYTGGAALLSALMLTVFAVAMAQARLRGIDLSCGCFGSSAASEVSWNKVALNAGLAMLSLWIVASQRTPAVRDPMPSEQPP